MNTVVCSAGATPTLAGHLCPLGLNKPVEMNKVSQSPHAPELRQGPGMVAENADKLEGNGTPGNRSRREMLSSAGFAALGGAAAATAAAEVAPMVFGPSVERDELGRYGHRRERPGACELRWCAETDRRALALTFDDGPDPEITPRVLASLARHGATATFFVVASVAEANRGLLERIVDEGHEVGNHSWSHLSVVDLDQAGTDREVARAQESLESMLGTAPRWFRPPRGQVTGAVMSAAARSSLDVALWTQRFGVDEPGEDPDVGLLLDGVGSGDFVLIHDGVVESVVEPGSRSALEKRRRRLTDASALDEVLGGLTSGGWTFDTVSTLVDSEVRRGDAS